MKEYLNKLTDGTYKLVVLSDVIDGHDGLIEIPEGADVATSAEAIYFWNTENNTTYVDGEGWVKSSDGGMLSLDEYLTETDYKIIWQRHTQPEELPFEDDETSINDQYAEIEKVRKEAQAWANRPVGRCRTVPIDEASLPDFLIEDTVNHPSHYASGEIECIDAMEAMLTPEQFIGYLRGNAFKYQWRYENKGGITDLEKAQWYLNKLISRIG